MWLFLIGYILPIIILSAFIVGARAIIPSRPKGIKWVLLLVTVLPVVNIIAIGSIIHIWVRSEG